MKFVIASDLHGEYGLFMKLLDKLGFTEDDRMIICGDVVDKGNDSVRLLNFILSKPNIQSIVGNHEYSFLKYYRSLLARSPDDFDEVLRLLRDYFRGDGELLDWDTVDALESLPFYIEEDGFICVHAGIPLTEDGRLSSPSEAEAEELVCDRRFKEPNLTHKSPKCVFFGHTRTDFICGKPRILIYPRVKGVYPRDLSEICKVHLDTGASDNGVMGCFCADTLKAIYVKK